MTEDNTEKMPDKLYLDLYSAIAHGTAGCDVDKHDISIVIENIMPILQAALDRRVAEAEERQRESIYEQMYLKIGNWGGPQREAFDEALIILGAILNAGGKGDE